MVRRDHPLPAPGAARLGPPDRAEAQACLDATLSAVDTGDGPTEWERGGISPYQRTTAREAADAAGRAYEAYGAEP